MRLIPILLMLMSAGCLATPDAVESAATTMDAAQPEPFLAEGTVWLPPSTGEERVETLIPFPVNATGSDLAVRATLASQYGPLLLPAVFTDVVLELRAPDGGVLAEGSLTLDEPEAELAAVAPTAGEHVLALLSYGGSDEQANGDKVDWRIEATPPS